MPVPIIAGAAAAVAARLAAKKAAQELAKKAVKKTVVKAASKNVKVKPARKPVGNPRNPAKELDGVANSFYRSWNPSTGIEDGVRSAGKSRAGRVANSKLSKKTVKSAKEPARRPVPDGRSPFSYKTIEINSAPKKTADSARAANAKALKAANKPTNKVGSKADKELRSRTKSVTLGKEETATLNDYYYGMPDMVQVMSRRTPVNEARSVNKFRPTPKKKTAAQLRPKKK